MSDFTKLDGVIPRTQTDLHRMLRDRQWKERPDEARSLRERQVERKKAEPVDVPKDDLSDLDKMFMSRTFEVRAGILACDVPTEFSPAFCDGSGHYKRRFYEAYNGWGWCVYELCPVSKAERELVVQRRKEQDEDAPKRRGTWRK